MNFQPLLDEWRIRLTAVDLRARWAEPHRKYHTVDHLDDLVRQIHECRELTDRERQFLLLAALFHDAVYDPRRNDNEERSAQLLMDHSDAGNPDIQTVVRIVRDTKDHAPSDELSKRFSEMDMNIATRQLSELLEWERGIRFEYSHYCWPVYVIGRIGFVRKLIRRYPENSENLKALCWRILMRRL